jgi:hypothetical protein
MGTHTLGKAKNSQSFLSYSFFWGGVIYIFHLFQSFLPIPGGSAHPGGGGRLQDPGEAQIPQLATTLPQQTLLTNVLGPWQAWLQTQPKEGALLPHPICISNNLSLRPRPPAPCAPQAAHLQPPPPPRQAACPSGLTDGGGLRQQEVTEVILYMVTCDNCWFCQ